MQTCKELTKNILQIDGLKSSSKDGFAFKLAILPQ